MDKLSPIIITTEYKKNLLKFWFSKSFINLFLWCQGLAAKYKRTVAQIVLRWGIQRNTVVIPKTSNLKRLEENFQVFDFELTKEDMDQIKSLDRKHRTNTPGKFWGIDLYA